MKKLFLTLFSTLMLFSSAAKAQGTEQTAMGKHKILTVFYSYGGNTARVAREIQAVAGGDLYEIKSDTVYPDEYRPMTQQAKREIEQKFRPKMTGGEIDVSPYDVVFIGSPNWWGTIPTQIDSFLESHDLAGKTVVPFVTHGGGGVQNTTRDLTAACKGCSVVQNGWVGYGAETDGVREWVNGLNL